MTGGMLESLLHADPGRARAMSIERMDILRSLRGTAVVGRSAGEEGLSQRSYFYASSLRICSHRTLSIPLIIYASSHRQGILLSLFLTSVHLWNCARVYGIPSLTLWNRCSERPTTTVMDTGVLNNTTLCCGRC